MESFVLVRASRAGGRGFDGMDPKEAFYQSDDDVDKIIRTVLGEKECTCKRTKSISTLCDNHGHIFLNSPDVSPSAKSVILGITSKSTAS